MDKNNFLSYLAPVNETKEDNKSFSLMDFYQGKAFDDKLKNVLNAYYSAGLKVLEKKLNKSVEKEKGKEYSELSDYEKVPILQEKVNQKIGQLKEKNIEIPKKTKKSLLGYASDILSVLDILRYPITNTIYHIAYAIREKEDPLEASIKVMKGIWKGLLLLEKRDSKDVLDYLFNKDKTYSQLKGWQKILIGISLDIVTDPTTYMTFGASSLLKTGTGKASAVTLKTAQKTAILTKTFENGVDGIVKNAVKQKAISKGLSEELVEAIGRTGKQYAERVATNINNMLAKEMATVGKKTVNVSPEFVSKAEDFVWEAMKKRYQLLLEKGKSVSPKNVKKYLEKISSVEFAKKNFPKWFNNEFTKVLSKKVSEENDVYKLFLDKLKSAYSVQGETYQEIIDNVKKTIQFRDYGLNFLGKKLIDMPAGKVGFIANTLGTIGKTINKEEEFKSIATPIKALSNFAIKHPSNFVSKLFNIGSQASTDLKEAFDVTNKWSKTFKNLHREELLEYSKATVRKAGVMEHFGKVKNKIDDLLKATKTKHITEETYNDVLDNLVFTKELEVSGAKMNELINQMASNLHKLGVKSENIQDIKNILIEKIAQTTEHYTQNKQFYDAIWDELSKNLDTMWDELVKRGLANAEEKVVNYFPRFIKLKDSKDFALVKDFSDIANIFALRTIPIKKLGEASGIQYLSPSQSLAKYYDRAIKKIQNHDTIKRIISEVGYKIGEDADKGKVLINVNANGQTYTVPLKEVKSDFVKCSIKGFENYFIPEEVNKTLEKVNQIILDPDVGGRIFNYFRYIQNIWKKLVTVYNFPAFHHRNQISNIWTFILKDGMTKDSVNSLGDATKLYKGLFKGQGSADKIIKVLDIFDTPLNKTTSKMVEKSEKEIMTKLKEFGVIKGDFSASMIEKVGNQLKFAVKRNALQKFEDVSSRYGAFWEDMMRSASFYSSLRQGKTIKEAIAEVNKWFIDYGDLTKFEKNVMKTIYPFYGWLKNNLVNQLTAMAETPFKYKMLTAKPMEAINMISEEEAKDLPEYMKTSKWINPFGIRWGKGENERILMLNPNLPFQDLMKLTSRGGIGDTLLGGLTPLLKTGAELLFNKNIYNKQAIERYEGELKELPATLQTFFLALPKEVKEKIGFTMDKNGNFLIPARYVYALENLLPFTRLSQLEPVVEAVSGASYQKERAPFKFLKTITGVSLTPLNINYYRRRNLEDLLYKLKRLQSKQPTSP